MDANNIIDSLIEISEQCEVPFFESITELDHDLLSQTGAFLVFGSIINTPIHFNKDTIFLNEVVDIALFVPYDQGFQVNNNLSKTILAKIKMRDTTMQTTIEMVDNTKFYINRYQVTLGQ